MPYFQISALFFRKTEKLRSALFLGSVYMWENPGHIPFLIFLNIKFLVDR